MVELSLSFNHKETNFSLDKTAAEQINILRNGEEKALMLSVKPGGCAGFTYDFNWVDPSTMGRKFEMNDATLIIREADLRLVDGGELKYVQSLAGSKFEVVNPNASNSCGCGKSFS